MEELRLLKAVEHYGFGNWDDIAKDIETRSAEDAKEEYINKFLNGTIGRHTWQLESDQRPILVDHTADDDLTLDELQVEKFSEANLEITPEQAAQLGYMQNRDDFEREYDPTAEQLVSNLSLTPEDDEIETALKLAQIDIYNRRLKERTRKKRLVRDYKLIHDFFRKFENGKVKNINQTKDERGLRLSLKNFRQFYSSDAFERLINSLERERILRIRLTELCRYRWNGLTKIDECDHFEKHAAANQHRSTGPFGHGKTVSPQSKFPLIYFSFNFSPSQSILHNCPSLLAFTAEKSMKNISIDGSGRLGDQVSRHFRFLVAQLTSGGV